MRELFTVHWGPWQKPYVFHETWGDQTEHYWMACGPLVLTWVR